MAGLRKYLLSVALLLSSLMGVAQGLPQLPVASEITVSYFPNGISCYLVANASRPGFADFALVQKGEPNEDSGRDALSELSHFDRILPYKYLASKGVGYRQRGYIETTKYYQAFRFDDVPVSDKTVCDSLCLMIFNIASLYPQTQAVIISGDIDSKALKDRMTALSMLTVPRKEKAQMPKYDFSPNGERTIVTSEAVVPSVAAFQVSFAAPRPPVTLMNTVQPLMNQLYADIFGTVLKEHAARIFRESGVSLLESGFQYRSAAESPAEERYTFVVRVPRNEIEAAIPVLARILADIDNNGITREEYEIAKRESLVELTRASYTPSTNSSYVERCMASYLYGANLAPEKTLKDFFDSRKLSGEKETQLFNSYVQSLVSKNHNVSVRYDTPYSELPKGKVAMLFDQAWDSYDFSLIHSPAPAVGTQAKSANTVQKAAKKDKVKLTFTSSEPITGGELWTFSNGMEVIYRREKGSGRFDYALMLRGGYASAGEINPGEGAFVSDLLAMSKIDGRTSREFYGYLRSNGIRMTPSVSLSDLRIVGSAPSDKMETVMDAIYSVARRREPDTMAFSRYLKEEPLRIDITRKRQAGLYEVMDSLLAPFYKYSTHKEIDNIEKDLPQRAERYFHKQFSHFNDGVLIIVGDIDKETLKSQLCSSLGSFPTGPALSVRPLINYPLRSGWSTYTVQASQSMVGSGEQSVNVAMSSFMPFSSNRYMAFRLALICVQKKIVQSLADAGMYAVVEGSYDIFPAEKINLYITVRPCQSAGLPTDIVPSDPVLALGDIRMSLSRIIAAELTDKELSSYKAVLASEMKSDSQNPEKMVENALIRYSLSKDLITGYDAKIKSVTAKQVKDILRTLDNGAKVEYIIY